MQVAIVKYNAGNVQSVRFALERLGLDPVWTDDPATLQQADRVIFPGVGEAASAMAYLRQRGLDTVIRNLTQPVLGICLGLQLLCAHSEEGDTPCMGVFGAGIRKFRPAPGFKIPHMGWNTLHACRGPLFAGLPDLPQVYFVHSYFAELIPATLAQTEYDGFFSAALQAGNFYAVQFHPEKSGETGARILKNFLTL